MNVKIKCPICNTMNDVSEDSNCTYQNKIFVNEKAYWTTYLKCVKCGKIICLQIDDEKTLKLLEDERKILRNAIQMKKKHKIVSKKITEEYHKIKNDLALSRNVLMQNTNKMQAIFADTCEKFIVRFYI